MKLDKKTCILTVALIAFLFRLQNISRVFSSQILLDGYDPYYHMRIVELIVKTGHLPDFDYYLNYPYGLKIGWLPLFDYILALPGTLFGFHASEIFAAIFPPLLGVIISILVFLIAFRIFGNIYVSFFSSLIAAVTPALVSISTVGFCDHHIWNLVLITSAIYFLLKAEDNPLYFVISGIFLLLLSFSWQGAPIFGAIYTILAFTEIINGKSDKYAVFAGISLLIPSISYLIKPFIGIAFLTLAVFIFLSILVKRINERYLNYYLIATIILIAVVYFFNPKPFMFIRSGIDYILGRNIYLPTISEAKSFELYTIFFMSGYFVILLATLGGIIAISTNKYILPVWFLAAFILALFQLRFTNILAIPSSVLAGYGLSHLIHKMGYPIFEEKKEEDNRIIKRGKRGQAKKTKKHAKKENNLNRDILTLIIIIFIISPSVVISIDTFNMSKDWEEALLWLRDNTPPTSHYLDPTKKPEYSVLSWWDYGNWIVYVAKRPVVCNNFQAGAIDAAKFFTTQNEEDALKIVKKRGVKYVITCDEMKLGGIYIAIMKIAGLNPDLMSREEIMNIYKNSTFYRLHSENSLKNFKLIYDKGGVKIFEVVK